MREFNDNHTTADGQIIPIQNMEQSHLKNTAHMFLARAVKYRDMASQLDANTNAVSPSAKAFNQGFYGQKEQYLDPLVMGRKARAACELAMPYIMEMAIRGAIGADTTLMLQQATGRHEKSEIKNIAPIAIENEKLDFE